MTNAKLRQYGLDRADLQASPPTPISEFRRIDVILAVWRQKRQCREPLDDVFACARSGEPLQQLTDGNARICSRMSRPIRACPSGRRAFAGCDGR